MKLFRKPTGEDWSFILKSLSVILSLYFMFVTIAFIGGQMNQFVQKYNDGKMPVYLPSFNSIDTWKITSYTDDSHFTYENFSEVQYPLLTDIIPINHVVYSIGDILMYASMGLTILVGLGSIYFGVKHEIKKNKAK